MVARKKKVTSKQGLGGWIMTYGDMMSLLLTFFVLIASFSSIQDSKFEEAAESLKDAFGVMARPRNVIERNRPLVPRRSDNDAAYELLFEVREIEKALIEQDLDQQVAIEVRPDGVLVQMPAPLLFKSGQAELQEVSRPLLQKLASLFRKFPGEVRIEGHTDDVPIKSPVFPSNWELSSGRAVTVARFFQGLGIPPDRLAATGYGEHRPRESNETPAGRAANRRVEILLARIDTPVAAEETLPLADPVDLLPPGDTPPATADPRPERRRILNPVTGRLGAPPGNERQ